ncbi:hypothetical protein DPMN_070010 [Dreissena polymorpha]|uniref:Uncharacterized protein n=1 Tax=Dreissena polymorpha TaxID=45954 RepID=A0A9D3Z4N0_DREPO|nr:hypothetical protein DPMN_070010 [Dreissena polymorpha]
MSMGKKAPSVFDGTNMWQNLKIYSSDWTSTQRYGAKHYYYTTQWRGVYKFAHLRGAKNVISRVHVIQLTGTIFQLNSHIKETNVLTKFHENWAKIGGHVFSLIWTIFELVRDMNKTNVLTNFHGDRAEIVTSRVFTSHVIQLTKTIFELNSHIKETNILTKFHENWAKNVTSRVFTCFHYIHIEKNAPPTCGHVFFTDLDHFQTCPRY